MPEPFKNKFSSALVEKIAVELNRVDSQFDHVGFIDAVNSELESLELKQRSDLISRQLVTFLPKDFTQSSKILLAVLGDVIDSNALDFNRDKLASTQGINGWAIMPMADYVATQGITHLEVALPLLKEMTKRFSAEFAIRPFLDEHTSETMQVVHQWALDKDEHVRRLASEGTRPRLPWGMRLTKFVQDPQPLLPILEILKDDPSEYVRRSVANNLNDISKDHPDLVAEIAEKWLVNANKERVKLVKHACRSLIKAGHPATLKALGYGDVELGNCSLVLSKPKLVYGDSIQLVAEISSNVLHDQSLMIDYVVHYQKANGGTSAKVFKWRTADLVANQTITISKKHTIKPITTRAYYPGEHRVELQVNGKVVAHSVFELVMPR